MMSAREPAKKICQNSLIFMPQNNIGFHGRKKPVLSLLSAYFTWVKSDKESSPVVGRFKRSGV